jgi:hypothetical protein
LRGLAIIFGIAMGFLIAVVGLNILNTNMSIGVDATNPMREFGQGVPLIGSWLAGSGSFGPEIFTGEVTIHNLNNLIFTGMLILLMSTLLLVFIALIFLTIWFGPSVLFLYMTFAVFCIVSFLLVYWLGSAYLMGA